MSLIKPKEKVKKSVRRIYLSDKLLSRIKAYIDWAGLSNYDEFFEQASEFVLKKDTSWRKIETNHLDTAS